MRGPEELFYAQGIIPSFLPQPKDFSWEENLLRVKQFHRDRLLAKYLDMFVEELNIPEGKE